MNIMRKCKNKLSTDCNKTGMAIVKEAIDGIVKLLTRICNMCFQMDTFPSKLKIFLLLDKAGSSHHPSNLRFVSILPLF